MVDTATNVKVNYLDSVLDPVLNQVKKLSSKDRQALSLDELVERTVKEYEEKLGEKDPLSDAAKTVLENFFRQAINEILSSST